MACWGQSTQLWEDAETVFYSEWPSGVAQIVLALLIHCSGTLCQEMDDTAASIFIWKHRVHNRVNQNKLTTREA